MQIEPTVAIIRDPLTVTTDISAIAAIATMNSLHSQRHTEQPHQPDADQHLADRSSCVVVVAQHRVVGIFTEQDVVRLSLQQQPLDQLPLEQVMRQPVITLRESNLTDLFATLNLLQRHRIRHLPIVDDQDCLVGLVTQTSLLQALHSLEIYQLAETLEKKVTRLEAEQISLRATRAAELERQVAERTAKLQAELAARQQSEAALKTQRDLNQLIAEISSRFVDFNPNTLDAEIEHTLQLIGGITQVDTSYLFTYDAESGTSSMTHEWCRADCPSQIAAAQAIPCWTLFPWSSPLIMERQVIHIPNLAELPPEAATDQAHWQGINLTSLLMVPLVQKSRVTGVIGFASFSQVTFWDEETIRLLQVMGQTISSAQQRVQDEQKLQKSEAHQRALISALPDLIMRINATGIYQEFVASPNFTVVGDIVDMVGTHIYESLPPKAAHQRLEAIQRVLATNEMQVYEQDLSKDGQLKIEEVRIVPYGDDEVLALVRDISDRKQVEQELHSLNQALEQKVDERTAALQDSETQLRAMVEAIPDILFRVRLDGDQLKYFQPAKNAAADQHYIPAHPAKLEFAEILAQKQQAVKQAITTGALQVYEHQIPLGDRLIYEEVRVVGISPDEALIMVRDVSARKQAEIALQNTNSLLATISQAQAQFIAAVNRLVVFEDLLNNLLDLTNSEYAFIGEISFQENGIAVMEESFLKIRGIPNLTTHNITNAVWDEEIQKFHIDNTEQGMEFVTMNALFSAVMMAGKPVIINSLHSNLRSRETPSSHPPLEALLGLPFFQGNTLMGMVGIANRPGGYDENMAQYLEPFLVNCSNLIERYRLDHQRCQAEERLHQTNEELLRATRLKDEFLAKMSHELRTPLNVILGMTEGFQAEAFGGITTTQLKALKTIERSGLHLLEVINDILDVAKIESGQMQLNCLPTAIAPLCTSSLAFIKQQALRKRIQIVVHVSPDLPDIVLDERRIRQVLINLLNNAAKFTPEGGHITLEATTLSQTDRDGEYPYLRLAVIDTGIGIAPENIQKLFQPFIQIDGALNRQYQGTGLGLTLVKQIVELHGGQVGLTSQVDRGSCFTIDLPYQSGISLASPSQPESPPDLAAPDDPLPAPALILLAGDDAATTSNIDSYLSAKGYRIQIAQDGQEIIALAQSISPTLILIDVQMSKMDALETMRHIRCDRNLAKTPIIALASLARQGDRDRCIAAGANEYLSKPIRLKQLVQSIQHLLAP